MAFGNKLNGTLCAFIEKQPMFFVATAAPDGRVNLSPKGMIDTLRILDNTTIRWLNLSGSGNETAAHLRLSPRMTMMFCAFNGDAMILRVYGTATVTHPHNADWAEKSDGFPVLAGTRQIFDLKIDKIQISCGSGVPVMAFEEERGSEELVPFYQEMGPDGVTAYWRKKNVKSIDGYATGIFNET